MTKGLQLPWKDSHAIFGMYVLQAYKLHAMPGEVYHFSVAACGEEEPLKSGTEPTLELAQAGAEDALRRYIDREGDDIYLAKCNRMLDERLKEKRFVNGKIIE